jgi:hypothetical protein
MDMTMTLRRYFIASSLLGLNIAAGTAQGADTAASHPCAGIGEDSARLACYDRTFGRGPAPAPMSAPASAKPVTAVPVAAAAGTAAAVPAVDAAEKAQREFGLSETGKRALDDNRSIPQEPESITARVKSASRRPTGEQVFVLENGQVWVETSTFTAARVQPGDEVTVRKGALGSFLLVTPKRVATHVRRLK